MTTTYTKFSRVELDLYQGDKETFTFNVTSGGNPFDLSGYTIKAQGRRDAGEQDTVFDITIPDSSPSDFSQGVVVLVLPSAVTTTLSGKILFDVQALLSGEPTTLVRGVMKVTEEIST